MKKVIAEVQRVISNSPELRNLCILGVTVGLGFILTKISERYEVDLDELLKEVKSMNISL